MKKIISNLVIAAAVIGAALSSAKAISISSSISSNTATSQTFMLFPNESLTYTLTGTATGQVLIEKSGNNSEFSSTGISVTGAGVVSSTGKIYSGSQNTYYRFRRTSTVVLTSGTFTCVMADVDDLVTEFKNNKQVRIVAINDDSFVISGGLIAASSTFTTVSEANPTLSGTVAFAAGSTVTYSGTLMTGTKTDLTTTTYTGAAFNGTKTDNSTTTYTGQNTFSGAAVFSGANTTSGTNANSSTITYAGAAFNGTKTDNSTTTYTGQNTFNGTNNIKGTGTNGTAASGYYGEYVSSITTVFTNLATSDTFQNIVSLSLTAGNWQLCGGTVITLNAAVSVGQMDIAISSYSANTTTDHIVGFNQFPTRPTVSGADQAIIMPCIPYVNSASSTAYLKSKAVFVSGNPQVKGSITARRMY